MTPSPKPVLVEACLLGLLLLAGCGAPQTGPTGGPAPSSAAAAGAAATDARTAAALAALPPVTGPALARRVRANLDLPYERLTYAMELSDSRGVAEKRQVDFHLATALDGQDFAYTCFTEPEEIRGFGLMTARRTGAEPDQFLYVPAAKKVSRVLYFSTNRRSSFCGTQFTFEDLEPLALSDFEFDVRGKESVDGRACYLLESRPKSRFSGYSKVLNWVDEASALSLKSVFHDPKGDLLKQGTARELFEAAPGHWRARVTEMVSRQAERATRMRLTGYVCATGALTPEQRQIFTLKTLSQGREQ
jgi:hypothetical protein